MCHAALQPTATPGHTPSLSTFAGGVATSVATHSLTTSPQSGPALHGPHPAPWPPSFACRRWGSLCLCTVRLGAATPGSVGTETTTGLQPQAARQSGLLHEPVAFLVLSLVVLSCQSQGSTDVHRAEDVDGRDTGNLSSLNKDQQRLCELTKLLLQAVYCC